MNWGRIRFDLVKETGVSDLELLSTWMNDAYVDILDARSWRGLDLDFDVVTKAPYEAGSVTLTQGSASIVGVGTVWTADMDGRQIYLAADPEPYRFNYLSATSASLDRPWPDETWTDASYQIVLAFYPVPENIKLVQWRRPKMGWGEVYDVPRGASATVAQVGRPRFWDPVDFADSGQRFIRLTPAPDDSYVLTFVGQQRPIGFDGSNVEDSPLPWIQFDAIRWYVKGCAYRHANKADQSVDAFKMYLNARGRMATLDDARQEARPARTASWMRARSIE